MKNSSNSSKRSPKDMQEFRKRMKETGFVRREYYVHEKDIAKLTEYANTLRRMRSVIAE
tara:strand:- start:1272 stop:1448 length:177 start_codon:yes stop_codon:yes gene_type:complete